MKEKRIGLLVLSIGNFGNKGFYNLQEVGLAKALSKYFKEVLAYKLVPSNQSKSVEYINSNTKFFLLPSKKIGSNGIPDLSELDSSLDVLICFSDTQLMFPCVYNWCKKNNIRLFPYIGVTRSNSQNFFIKTVINLFNSRNLFLYKHLPCLAKTPYVSKCLRSSGVNSITLAPVGLDVELIKNDIADFSSSDVKKAFGFDCPDKIILFVGRLTDEKKPIEMLSYFQKISCADYSHKLLMVGTGELREQVLSKISELNLDDCVKLIDKIPNKEMWRLYKTADCFVNLNTHEIFGMAILEALFYDCKVVAWSAPGPDYILKNGVNGWLVNSEQEFINKILDSRKFETKGYILDAFTWNSTASTIYNLLNNSTFALR